MKANERTGLARQDVFYYGNLVGETGDGSGALPLRVTAMDLAAVRRNTFSAGPITSRYDFNRDGRVKALDVVAVRSNLGETLAPFGAAPVIAAASDGGAGGSYGRMMAPQSLAPRRRGCTARGGGCAAGRATARAYRLGLTSGGAGTTRTSGSGSVESAGWVVGDAAVEPV